MDPIKAIQLASAALTLYTQVIAMYPSLRASLSGNDRDELDKAYDELVSKSNAVADRLRVTPDDAT